MVFICKTFSPDEEDEAFCKNSAQKRAEELTADEKSRKTRGRRATRVVPVVNDNTESRQQTDLGGAKSKNGSRRLKVAPEASFEEQNPQNFELLHPQPPKGSHGSDDKKSPDKIENPSAEKILEESVLQIKLFCPCESCRWKIRKAANKYKGVCALPEDTSTDLVRVTGIVDVKEFLIHLKKKLHKKVQVVHAEKDDYPDKDGKLVRHIANMTDDGSRKKEAYPDLQEKQNLEKTRLKHPQPRERDRNDNEETGMVHLKIGMYCQEGCTRETRKTAMAFPGVKSVKINASKNLVIVVGTIKVKKLVANLKEKLNRSVEVVHVQNDNVAVDNKDVEVTKIETLKEPAAARADGRKNKDVEIKKEVKKQVKDRKIKKEVEDMKEEDKKYSLCDGGDGGTEEDREDKKGKEGVEDKVTEAEGRGYTPHAGKENKDLEREGDNRSYYQNYGNQVFPRCDQSNYDVIPVYCDGGIPMLSDENPNACTIM